MPGANWPSAMPATMHSSTHTVRYRSNTLMAETVGARLADALAVMVASLASNVVQLTLQGHGIEALERQRQEQFYAPAQRDGRVHERLALLFLGAFDGGRVGHAPMRRDGLARPQRTRLAGGVVADGEDEVEHRRTGNHEFVPALAAVARGRQAQAFQRGECQRIHFAFRSEEHTSELQSQSNLVCRLLLEKK